MVLPPFLKSGDLIGITCPSSYVDPTRVAGARDVLESWGFRVRLGVTVGLGQDYFSGTDAERLADLQRMLDDPELSTVLMGRGGYGLSRIIDQLDLTAFRQRPKWICGFSDITVLLSHVQAQAGIACMHTPMCGAIRPDTKDTLAIRSLFQLWSGERARYELPPYAYNRHGAAEGILTGGNLSILSHLIGSSSDVSLDGAILFLEDIDEYLYRVDRMLYQLRRAGKLARLAGLVVGQFTRIVDTERPFGQTIEALIAHHVADYDYPVCFHFPAGHDEPNMPLVFGALHQFSVRASGVHLTMMPQ